MFKTFALQALINLAENQTYYQACNCLSFMQFQGFDLEQRIPNATTIGLFGETLPKVHIMESLF